MILMPRIRVYARIHPTVPYSGELDEYVNYQLAEYKSFPIVHQDHPYNHYWKIIYSDVLERRAIEHKFNQGDRDTIILHLVLRSDFMVHSVVSTNPLIFDLLPRSECPPSDPNSGAAIPILYVRADDE
jgi:hypothetical protein